MSMNRVNIIGRLTADPVLRTTPNQISVVSFTIAVDRNTKTSNGEKSTDFIDCVAWRTTAEFICNYFGKGRKIAIDGRLQTRNYTDKENNKRKVTEILVDEAYFADDKRKENNAEESPIAEVTMTEITDGEDELPF